MAQETEIEHSDGLKELDKHIKMTEHLIGEPKTAVESGLAQLTVSRAAVELIAEGQEPAKGIAACAKSYIDRVRASFARRRGRG